MYKTLILLFFINLLLITGCANRSTGYQSPEFEISGIKYLYVAHQPKDKRNINLLIKGELEKWGFKVDTGNITNIPNDIDALVTYIDKWMWDITTYMFELSIFIKNPNTEYPIAKGHSLHGSLTRLSPEEMVEEVVANMLGKSSADREKGDVDN